MDRRDLTLLFIFAACVVVLVPLVASPALLGAPQEPTGLRVRGTTWRGATVEGQLEAQGNPPRLWVRPAAGQDPIEAAEFSVLRVQDSSLPDQAHPMAQPPFQLRFWGAETVSGSLIEGQADQLRIRFARQMITVPLAFIASVAHYQDLLPIVKLSFEELPAGSGVQLQGDVAIELGGGAEQTGCLVLRAPGASLQVNLKEPVFEGVVQLLVRGPDPATQLGPAEITLLFERSGKQFPVQIRLLPRTPHFGLATPSGPAASVELLERKEGWQRLRVELGEEGLLLLVDDNVLSSLRPQVGSLTGLRVTLSAPANGAPLQSDASAPASAFLYLDDLWIARRQAPTAERQPSPDQDEVLLLTGDQFYGTLKAIGAEQLEMETGFGRLVLPWSKVARLYLAPRPSAPVELAGQRLRVLFRPAHGLGIGRLDNLEGVLAGTDGTTLRLQHPVLGELLIPGHLVEALVPGRFVHWLLLDYRFHHLGNEVHLDLQRPYPEGTSLSWTFALSRLPRQAWLVADVQDMEPMIEGARYYTALRRGELRTVVELNGVEVDFLNRYLVLSSGRQAQRVRVPLPQEHLRVGQNQLTIRQLPQKEKPDSFDDCGLFSVSLEWLPEASTEAPPR
jgi:hypothetical protein